MKGYVLIATLYTYNTGKNHNILHLIAKGFYTQSCDNF